MSAPLTTFDELTIVKLLATKNSPAFTATATRHDEDTVLRVGKRNGYPNLDALTAARKLLERKIDSELAPQPAAAANGKPRPRTAPPTEPRPTPRSVPAVATVPSMLKDVLARAEQSANARTRSLGKRIADLLRDLGQRLEAEAAESREREADRRAREQAEAELARLQREVAAAKERVKRFNKGYRRAGPPKLVEPSPGISYNAVREWAKANGYEVADRGKPPKVALEAYREAHS